MSDDSRDETPEMIDETPRTAEDRQREGDKYSTEYLEACRRGRWPEANELARKRDEAWAQAREIREREQCDEGGE